MMSWCRLEVVSVVTVFFHEGSAKFFFALQFKDCQEIAVVFFSTDCFEELTKVFSESSLRQSDVSARNNEK